MESHSMQQGVRRKNNQRKTAHKCGTFFQCWHARGMKIQRNAVVFKFCRSALIGFLVVSRLSSSGLFGLTREDES